MKVNGEDVVLAEAVTLLRFLTMRGYDEKLVAVERNGEIVPRAAFGGVELSGGDTIEILHFVGGG
jgi:sulfur carrier protein